MHFSNWSRHERSFAGKGYAAERGHRPGGAGPAKAATLTPVVGIDKRRRSTPGALADNVTDVTRTGRRKAKGGQGYNDARWETCRYLVGGAPLLEASLFGSVPRSAALEAIDDFLAAVAPSRLCPRGASCHSRCVRVREYTYGACVRACVRQRVLGGHGGRRTALPRLPSLLRYVTLRPLRNRGEPTRRTRRCAASRTSTPLKPVPLVAAVAATFARKRRARASTIRRIRSSRVGRQVVFFYFYARPTTELRPVSFSRPI